MASANPTKAQMRFLVGMAERGGVSPPAYNIDVANAADFLRTAEILCRRGWTANAGPDTYALTWAGWQVLPKLLDADCAERAGVTASSWNDYAKRRLTPTPAGFTAHPQSGRAVRFWWPWEFDAWIEQRGAATMSGRPANRPIGQRQCMWRKPGSTGRAGFCRAAIGAEHGVCTRGHTDADRAIQHNEGFAV